MPRSPDSPRKTTARRTLVLGGAAAAVAGAAAYRRMKASGRLEVGAGARRPATYDDDVSALRWGALGDPVHRLVATRDGAQLAVWDVGEPSAPTVVLPHCWGCSHEVWILVARRLVDAGYRTVLYDQRGHGGSGRGTAPLSIEGLGDDLATVLEACDVHDAVLAGHSMGGMTVMSLATYRPEVLNARARALVLVATAAVQVTNGRSFGPAGQFASRFIGSPLVTSVLLRPSGYRYVRNVFGTNPALAQMEITARLFGQTDGSVRGGYLSAMVTMNLVQGIRSVEMPTTVMVGSRDRLTPPAQAAQIVATIPGARLITLADRGHMLPLEDPDAVADEIIRAVKG